MQKVPSDQSTKTIQQAKLSENKTSSKPALNDKTSSTAKQGDETKRPADNTDHTTVSTSFCGCKKDKCDAFFDKLLCYLEKQSDIIAKCCTNNREHRKGSSEKLMYGQDLTKPSKDSNKNKSTDKSTSSQEKPPIKHHSPCKDDPEPRFHRQHSVETQNSRKGRIKDKIGSDEDSECKPSRYKSQLDVGGSKQLGDKPCNIYVEVCSCQKHGREQEPSRRRSPKPLEADCDQYPSKQRSATPPHRQPSGKSNEYGIDCHDCEKKVCCFFKLAEEICQGYMKQCQEQDPNLAHSKSNYSNRKRNSCEDFGNQAPSRPYQAQPCNEGSDESYMKPEKKENEAYYKHHARPISIEVECQGTKEEFIVDPCQCESRHRDGSYGRGRPSPVPSRMGSQGPKKSCLEVFEERYGKMLRDLHAKLFPDPNVNSPPGYPPQGYPQQGYPPQSYPPPGYPPPGYPNPYGDAAPQKPPRKQPPPGAPKQEPKPPPKESKQSEDDDSSDERKKPKKKDKKEDKKKKKKKGSKDS